MIAVSLSVFWYCMFHCTFLILEGLALITSKMLHLIVYQFYIAKSKTKQKSHYREAGRNPKIVKEVSIWPNISCVIGGSLAFLILLSISISFVFCMPSSLGLFHLLFFFFGTFKTPSFKNLLFDTPWEKYSLISLLKESHSIFYISLPYLAFPLPLSTI